MKQILISTLLLIIPLMVFSQGIFQKDLVVKATILNLRDAPNIKGEIIEKIKGGTLIRFLETISKKSIHIGKKEGYWIKIKTPLNSTGYVFSAYVARPYGIYHPYPDDVDYVLDVNWYALHQKPSGFQLKKIEQPELRIEAEEDYSYSTFSFEGQNKRGCLGMISSVKELKEDTINTLFQRPNIDNNFLLKPGTYQKIYEENSKDRFKKLDYLIYGTGKFTLGRGGLIKEDYKIYLVRRDREWKQITQDLSIDMKNYGENGFNIIFAGDIDGDNKPDLIISEYDNKTGIIYLFLSSEADKGKLVKLVAQSEVYSKC